MEETKKRWLRRKRKRTCSREGKGEGGDGLCVGGVGGSGGRLFFYLSLTLRRERTHRKCRVRHQALLSLLPSDVSERLADPSDPADRRKEAKKTKNASASEGCNNNRMSLDCLWRNFAEKGVVTFDAVQIR